MPFPFSVVQIYNFVYLYFLSLYTTSKKIAHILKVKIIPNFHTHIFE